MNRIIIAALSFTLIFGVTSGVSEADASGKVKKYKNCTELNKDYKGGVARTSKVKNKGGKTKYKPFVSKKLYDLNKGRDRDKDLIACER
ncbi:excalibur calcium-binding domain-containing protein [Bacillus sp. 31A1R]|uniref:Excalibur calcium-binding domain-containing protein n=1 Tax=Robertmurraya mangrovi TaxID=3098077 RepID=A0ABU5IVX6_9BACI|nr:excalibur calcium-binding domain-containing protein [Bacillus sp. 31A1R]MDZ5471291.1 excalibur calcium-binding domain-containing protein [Bacillus sp. 31A1R]